MRRYLMDRLIAWKHEVRKKPLILQGARQVGKTWLMKEFGRNEYEQVIYVNLENNSRMFDLFSRTMEIPSLIRGLEIEFSGAIDPDNALIIIDEIQEVPQALTSLKYFQEYEVHYDIICAGSFLGVGMHEGVSFPVGKVSFLRLMPLCFEEFLEGIGEAPLSGLLRDRDEVLLMSFRDRIISLLKEYLVIGGMPAVVNEYVRTRDLHTVRTVQKELLMTFEHDFSKHAPDHDLIRIYQVWKSLPAQLAREQRKFTYGLIKTGARAREYEKAITWLVQAGLIHRIPRVTRPSIPLSAYEDMKAFKLFFLDVGLLGALCNLSEKALLEGNELFVEFKGAITEQYVIQEMAFDHQSAIWYWSADRAAAEIDALIESERGPIPIEIKAGENLHAKSLRSFYDRFSPALVVRTSLSDYREEQWLCNIPLYLISHIDEICRGLGRS